MLITGHKRQLVQACFPESQKEALMLWNEITPVRFGDNHQWTNAPNQVLAFYQIPEDANYLAIMKVECYTFVNTAAGPGFRNFEPPPNGEARWVLDNGPAGNPASGLVPIHLLAEASDLIVAKDSQSISLVATLAAPPDANPRFIRTTVYAYHISARIADRIGLGESLTFGRNT